jgi:hypothetical protein
MDQIYQRELATEEKLQETFLSADKEVSAARAAYRALRAQQNTGVHAKAKAKADLEVKKHKAARKHGKYLLQMLKTDHAYRDLDLGAKEMGIHSRRIEWNIANLAYYREWYQARYNDQ